MSNPARSSEPPPPSRGDGFAPPPPRVGCSGPFAAVLVGGLVLLAVATGMFLGRCSSGKGAAPPASVSIIRPTPDVITAVRNLSRLESAEYHVERVIDLTDKQTRLFGLIETEDAVLLVAAGDVVAGVDLAELGEKDFSIDMDRKRVRIVLPAPKILSSRLDNERTYVHTRRTQVLARRKESLESEARREAERSIVEAAKQGGIEEKARQNAQRTLESLARSLGYSEVQIEFRK